MSELRACKECKRIYSGKKCPVCNSTEKTTNWRGYLIVLSENSKVARMMDIEKPGKYAIRVR